MSNRVPLLLTALAAAVLLPLSTPSTAAAQSAGVTMEACYVPGSGTVYRINTEGAPDTCRSRQHVRFTWTASLPAGRCPAGQFMVGLGPDGALLCEPVPGGPDDPPPPQTFPTGFEGFYALDPAIVLSECGGSDPVSYVEARIIPGNRAGTLGLDLIDGMEQGTLWTAAGIYASFDASTNSFVIDEDHDLGEIQTTLDVSGSFPTQGQLVMSVLGVTTLGDDTCTLSGSTTGTLDPSR